MVFTNFVNKKFVNFICCYFEINEMKYCTHTYFPLVILVDKINLEYLLLMRDQLFIEHTCNITLLNLHKFIISGA